MTEQEIEYVKQCISEEDKHRFYCGSKWEKIRRKVLEIDHYECQKCKKRGRYSKAVLVHHVHHLKEYPELALEIYDKEGNRNLISLCQSCHEEEHPDERHRWHKNTEGYINEERW